MTTTKRYAQDNIEHVEDVEASLVFLSSPQFVNPNRVFRCSVRPVMDDGPHMLAFGAQTSESAFGQLMKLYKELDGVFPNPYEGIFAEYSDPDNRGPIKVRVRGYYEIVEGYPDYAEVFVEELEFI